MKWFISGFVAIVFGFFFAMGMSKVHAQVVGPPPPGPRFWMSDYTEVGGGDHYQVWMLHDNKFREVCFLVVANQGNGVTSIALTPRQC